MYFSNLVLKSLNKEILTKVVLNYLKLFSVSLVIFTLQACNTSKVNTTDADKEESEDLLVVDPKTPLSWNEIMKKLERNMVDLFPLMVNPQEFQQKKNQDRILKRLENLKVLSQKANHSPMLTLNDPSLSFVSFDFQSQLQLSKNAFEAGNKDFARMELLKTTQFCIECHTQTQKGPQFGNENLKNILSKMSLLDQAEVYTATRKFDKAIEKYYEFFKLEQVGWDAQFRTENALHNGLSILIRYRRDPLDAGKFLFAAEKASFIPLYLKNVIGIWKEDIKAWSLIHQRKVKFATIKNWMEKSDSRRFEYGNLGGEIWNLLSISYLHEMLDHWSTEKTQEKSKAEIFQLLGMSYVNSSTHFQTSLGSKYLESCIRTASHTPIAQVCYRKLEEYTYDMNSGTAGTFMSLSDEMLLKDLKKLSTVE